MTEESEICPSNLIEYEEFAQTDLYSSIHTGDLQEFPMLDQINANHTQSSQPLTLVSQGQPLEHNPHRPQLLASAGGVNSSISLVSNRRDVTIDANETTQVPSSLSRSHNTVHNQQQSNHNQTTARNKNGEHTSQVKTQSLLTDRNASDFHHQQQQHHSTEFKTSKNNNRNAIFEDKIDHLQVIISTQREQIDKKSDKISYLLKQIADLNQVIHSKEYETASIRVEFSQAQQQLEELKMTMRIKEQMENGDSKVLEQRIKQEESIISILDQKLNKSRAHNEDKKATSLIPTSSAMSINNNKKKDPSVFPSQDKNLIFQIKKQTEQSVISFTTKQNPQDQQQLQQQQQQQHQQKQQQLFEQQQLQQQHQQQQLYEQQQLQQQHQQQEIQQRHQQLQQHYHQYQKQKPTTPETVEQEQLQKQISTSIHSSSGQKNQKSKIQLNQNHMIDFSSPQIISTKKANLDCIPVSARAQSKNSPIYPNLSHRLSSPTSVLKYPTPNSSVFSNSISSTNQSHLRQLEKFNSVSLVPQQKSIQSYATIGALNERTPSNLLQHEKAKDILKRTHSSQDLYIKSIKELSSWLEAFKKQRAESESRSDTLREQGWQMERVQHPQRDNHLEDNLQLKLLNKPYSVFSQKNFQNNYNNNNNHHHHHHQQSLQQRSPRIITPDPVKQIYQFNPSGGSFPGNQNEFNRPSSPLFPINYSKQKKDNLPNRSYFPIYSPDHHSRIEYSNVHVQAGTFLPREKSNYQLATPHSNWNSGRVSLNKVGSTSNIESLSNARLFNSRPLQGGIQSAQVQK